MKNISLFLLALFLAVPSFVSIAQNRLLSDGTVMFNNSEQAAVVVLLEPKPEVVEAQFEDWLKTQHQIKLKGNGLFTNKATLSAEKVNLPTISTQQLDFYVRVDPEGEMSRMSVFASLGYDVHLNPTDYPTEYYAMKQLTIRFLRDFMPSWYQNHIDEIKGTVGELAEEKMDLSGRIAENDAEIARLQTENESLRTQWETTREALEAAIESLNWREAQLSQLNLDLKLAEEGND